MRAIEHYKVTITPPGQFSPDTGKPKPNFMKPYTVTFNHLDIMNTIMDQVVVSGVAVMEITFSPFGQADLIKKNAFIRKVRAASIPGKTEQELIKQRELAKKVTEEYPEQDSYHKAKISEYMSKKEVKNV